jgi:hypothetical protein
VAQHCRDSACELLSLPCPFPVLPRPSLTWSLLPARFSLAVRR